MKAQIKAKLEKEIKKIPKGKKRKINLKFMGTMANGEQIIGTQYLHNSRPEVGNFVISGKLSKDKYGNVGGKLSFVWNDIIDPNYAYPTDKMKAKLAQTLAGDLPTDYIVKVKWKTNVLKTRDGKKSSWPFR
ncbi:putative uncharacterized protein [Clostridium sp. CAG:411]|nr:hypothetical protein [Lachnospiraceae bacterium]CDE43491.1 putative uncharacterized protein [Clostridium sp. CAG:411]